MEYLFIEYLLYKINKLRRIFLFVQVSDGKTADGSFLPGIKVAADVGQTLILFSPFPIPEKYSHDRSLPPFITLSYRNIYNSSWKLMDITTHACRAPLNYWVICKPVAEKPHVNHLQHVLTHSIICLGLRL